MTMKVRLERVKADQSDRMAMAGYVDMNNVLPVVICDTVYFVVYIYGERHSIETFITETATKTTWMIRLPHGL